jgi:ribosomal protein S18 acetylase RimI-like enzyme
MPLIYRIAEPEDAAQCITLRGLTRQNAISVERLSAMGITVESCAADIRAGAVPGYVCLSNEKIIGYCFGVRRSGEILVLALLPEFENQGIGKALLGLVVRELQDFGFSRLFLGCSPDSTTRSYGFYRHLGWRSTHTFDVAGDEVLEYILECNSIGA